MGKKLKMPAAASEPKNEQPAEPAEIAQATALLESDTPAEATETEEGPKTEPPVHVMYVTGDEDCPRQILDVHGEVVLAMCRKCGRAESELSEPCVVTQVTASEVANEPASEVATEAPAKTPAAEQMVVVIEPGKQPITAEHREAYGNALQKHWDNRRQWERDVEYAKEKHTTAAIVRSQADDARKAAKASEDDALEELMDLLNSEPQEPTFAEVVAELAKKAAQTATSDQPETAAASQPTGEPNTSEAWRAVKISALGLKEKLHDKLEENGIYTIGQLEDRRVKIYAGEDKWPFGIGPIKVTAIEDALLKWLGENRDKSSFEDLQSGHASEQPAETMEAQAAEQPAETATAAPVADKSNPEAFADAINARAVELDDGTPGCLDDQLKAGYWTQGYEHYEAGGELRACELPPSPAQDDFIRGWLAAGLTEDYPDAEEADEEPPAGEEPELQTAAAGDGPQLFDPDNI